MRKGLKVMVIEFQQGRGTIDLLIKMLDEEKSTDSNINNISRFRSNNKIKLINKLRPTQIRRFKETDFFYS